VSIITLQRQVMEVGRVRIGGEKPERGAGRKLEYPRLTSPHRDLIERAARSYGGEVQEWAAPSGLQYQVYCDRPIRVGFLPMAHLYEQWNELWQRGGCQRRCDGVTEHKSGKPCICTPDKRECKPVTRAWVVLLDVGGYGTWRIETGSYYAAVEMGGVLELAETAMRAGQQITATMSIEHRSIARDGQTRKFIVPVLRPDLDIEMFATGQVQQLAAPAKAERPSLGAAAPLPSDPGFRELEPGDSHRPMNDKEQADLFAAVEASGIGPDKAKAVLQAIAKVESSADLTTEHYDEVMSVIRGEV
jgi:hypothetical protein